MELVLAILLVVGVFAFVMGVRRKDLPETEPVAASQHLEEKKARIYEGLRDLQFEYRVGKLSEEDYQRTKLDLQKELASVMAAIEAMGGTKGAAKPRVADGLECPSCGTHFDQPMKFCGQCGKALPGSVAEAQR
jgi:hypothetical protein